MAEDYELPVWGIRPNWADPVLETLEWRTDVLSSGTGAEQRIAYRMAPRRLVEARFNPFENERTFADLALHRLGRNEWMMPLFFDAAKLAVNAALGATRLDFSTAYHEFSAGGMAYLVGPDCFSGEAVRIEAVDDNGIDLTTPLVAGWAAGMTIHPLRRGRFETPNGRLLTSRVAELRARFEIIQGNDLSAEGDWATLSGGIPVLTAKSEWSEPIDFDLSWLSEEFDSETGLKYVIDDAGRAFRQQRHAFVLQGAQEQFEFRQLLYRLRGQQQPIWVPTGGDDLNVAVPKAAGVTQIDVQQVGFAYVGGPADGRNRLHMPNGQIVLIDSAATIANARERLTLAAPTTAPLPIDTRLSFIEACRLAGDSVEIEHLGDTEGVARSTLAFTAFANRRSATTAAQPIPEATKNSIQCGNPGFAGLSWQLPCLSGGSVCACADPAPQTYGAGGIEGVSYTLNLRVRAVVETSAYSGGTPHGSSGRVIKNATGHAPGAHNVYVLHVSDPPASYYLNNGDGGEYVTAIDYEVDIPINGGATVTLAANSEGGTQIANIGAVVVANDDPAYPITVSQPYNGQFMQIDGEAPA
ncbi:MULTISPECIES: hypothetical protein [unclassified Sphingopyxis]|uniref:hypothetical protein n=1 Tax=unclassified Sphingopyxis TaxID=2614943 RepID=UPI00285C4BD9|nr:MULTISPECIES: hypothetical protein [unclassified Sphingopyxis]MDR7062012.1 hypothetical protein [Sphingopyxis sp. BE235]MDR7182470.1 hypothetical protein [Sphingopyxis sp. BE249]